MRARSESLTSCTAGLWTPRCGGDRPSAGSCSTAVVCPTSCTPQKGTTMHEEKKGDPPERDKPGQDDTDAGYSELPGNPTTDWKKDPEPTPHREKDSDSGTDD